MRYNLAKDLGEQQNLAGENPDIVERLRKRMLELDAAARPVWKKP